MLQMLMYTSIDFFGFMVISVVLVFFFSFLLLVHPKIPPKKVAECLNQVENAE